MTPRRAFSLLEVILALAIVCSMAYYRSVKYFLGIGVTVTQGPLEPLFQVRILARQLSC